MSYNFSVNEIMELLSKKKSNSIKFDFLKTKGLLEIDTKSINEHIILHKSRIYVKEDTKISQDLYQYKGIFLNIVLDGLITHDKLLTEHNASFKKSYTTTSFINEIGGISQVSKKSEYKCISMFINENFIPEDILEKIKTEKSIKLLNFAPTNSTIKFLSNEIYNSPFKGQLNNIFIQSKALDILYHELLNISNLNSKKPLSIKFSEYDKEALKKAKRIIITNVNNPPSISELSKQVKLNEFKLKSGFKKFFGLAPYELLFEYRMTKAKELLTTSEYNINEISSKVGYKYAQSFSSAFRRKYGKNPKDLMKKRGYYF